MKKMLTASAILIAIFACKEAPKTATTTTKPDSTAITESREIAPSSSTLNDYEIVIGKSVGKVAATATYADLVKIFGETNLKTDTVSVAEGSEEDIATFVKSESKEEIIVFWRDDAVKKQIDRIQIFAEDSPYKTTEGVKIGTTLSQLEQLNGTAFQFYGFGWDYGGVVSDWKKGKFEGGKLHVTLNFIAPNVRYDTSKLPFMGDQDILSSDAKIKSWRDKIKVQLIEISF